LVEAGGIEPNPLYATDFTLKKEQIIHGVSHLCISL